MVELKLHKPSSGIQTAYIGLRLTIFSKLVKLLHKRSFTLECCDVDHIDLVRDFAVQ